jgi:hypothetical protein
MSDAHRYFMDHAVEAVRKARAMPPGHWRQKQRTVGRVYHLLAKSAADASVARTGLLRRIRLRPKAGFGGQESSSQ